MQHSRLSCEGFDCPRNPVLLFSFPAVHFFRQVAVSFTMSPIGDQVTVTPTNLSALVSICTIVCLLLSIFSVAGRIFTKNTVVRKLTADDYIILGATVHP